MDSNTGHSQNNFWYVLFFVLSFLIAAHGDNRQYFRLIVLLFSIRHGTRPHSNLSFRWHSNDIFYHFWLSITRFKFYWMRYSCISSFLLSLMRTRVDCIRVLHIRLLRFYTMFSISDNCRLSIACQIQFIHIKNELTSLDGTQHITFKAIVFIWNVINLLFAIENWSFLWFLSMLAKWLE